MTHDIADMPWRDELRELLAALREDVLTPEQGERLSRLLRESDAALATYVRTIAMQADLLGYLVGWASTDPTGERADDDDALAAPQGSGAAARAGGGDNGFEQTIYGLSVAEDALRAHGDDEREPLTAPTYAPRRIEPVSRFRIGGPGMLGAVGGVAAALLIGVGVWLGGGGGGRHPAPVAVDAGRSAVAVTPPASQPAAPELPTTAPQASPAPRPPAPPAPPPVVALVSASVGAVWSEAGTTTAAAGDVPRLGSTLIAGRQVQLIEGYARLTFVNGVEVIVEAPARVTLESATRVLLDRGRLTAKVPDRAHGFAVGTGVVEIVDLGTEFGVNVTPAGDVDVPVFTGKVQARPAPSADASGQTAPPAAQVVDAGQTVRAASATGVKVEQAGSETASFVRDIRTIRGPIPARGTGQGLKIGDPDPRWQLVADSNDRAFAARPAVVCGPGPVGLDNDDRSAWVSTAGDRPNVPGGKYTFATTFDLAGFDPSTVELHLALGVDNFVREVLLNGKPTGLVLARPPNEAKSKRTASEIKEGFVPGENRLEIVVENGAGVGTKNRPNAMALRAELSGTAVRVLDTR
jgi:hypothetical protein